ncbi:MAG: rRNA maturation RNase YbeY [Boseongicola sp.]|nr:MAG: rRNA maturation RNase YbeY [Boseongicola sp.]
MSVDVIIEDMRWEKTGLEGLAARATAATLLHLELAPTDWDIALLACDDTQIATLNAEFREKPAATNVLSWPSAERGAVRPGDVPLRPGGDSELGDIAISYDTCAREADAAGKPFDDHVLHLIVHGVLHLLGYDHISDADGDLMEATETAILGKLGVPDPY